MKQTETVQASRPSSRRRFFHPFDLGLLDGMRQRAEQDPLWKVMDWAAAECGLRVEVSRGSLCPEGPQVIVGNDPSPVVGFVLHSVLRRDDVYFVGAPGWMLAGRCVAARCFPAYTPGRWFSNPLEAFRMQVVYRFLYGVKPSSLALRNAESLTRAAGVVTTGGSLLILPAAGSIGRSDHWKHGVGYVLDRVTNPQTRLVFARVHGTRQSDVARMLNPRWFGRWRKPLTVPVEFSDPFPLSGFQRPELTPKQISLRVKEQYLKLYGAL